MWFGVYWWPGDQLDRPRDVTDALTCDSAFRLHERSRAARGRPVSQQDLGSQKSLAKIPVSCPLPVNRLRCSRFLQLKVQAEEKVENNLRLLSQQNTAVPRLVSGRRCRLFSARLCSGTPGALHQPRGRNVCPSSPLDGGHRTAGPFRDRNGVPPAHTFGWL